jgi:type I restriction-modification system DNA methylase subunit
MWINYSDSEVNVFHPICEKAIRNALVALKLDREYEVLHHEHTGTLEMDFVIRNIATKKYFCVIEVKRTPADVQSARFQYQAMSYVQMNEPNNEAPFYLLTNLECLYAFRYDPARPRVVQQILQPGMVKVSNFSDSAESVFIEKLSQVFSRLMASFIKGEYAYTLTLDQFEQYMAASLNDDKKWKSSLAMLLYQYIRGSLLSVGRKDLADISVFRNNIMRICEEAARVNFSGIFSFSDRLFNVSEAVDKRLLDDLLNLGQTNISGEIIADVLHQIVSHNREHIGEVPTDPELARLLAVVAKSISGPLGKADCICDPASGSGNLISSAIDIYNIQPKQVKANDSNNKLIELLSLRLGLKFPKEICLTNSSKITVMDMLDLPSDYFDNVKAILLNPPFVAGINCVDRKNKFFQRIYELTQTSPITNIGQMDLSSVFLEALISICKPGTTIAAIFPITPLVSRGREAVATRKFLLEKFGLQAIVHYPREGLFEGVVKGTCIIVGKSRCEADEIKFISSYGTVSNIDLNEFQRAIGRNMTDSYEPIMSGIIGMSKTKEAMNECVNDGWREVSQAFIDAIKFKKLALAQSPHLITLLSAKDAERLVIKRGPAGNSGASDLIFIDKKSELYKQNNTCFDIGLRNADVNSLDISQGDSGFLNINKVGEAQLNTLIESFLNMPNKTGKQPKNTKTQDELITILRTEAKKIFKGNSVFIPRLIRGIGKTFYSFVPLYLSTNFVGVECNSNTEMLVLASWTNTIFYQLDCEINAKNQEGVRKLEVADVGKTLIPKCETLTAAQVDYIIANIDQLSSVNLNRPQVTNNDRIWAIILFGDKANDAVEHVRRLLEFIANERNPIKVK